MKIHDIKQGSDEWSALRLGKITGTRLKDVFAKDNTPLIDELISEIGAGITEPNFINFAMQQGIDREPLARNEYKKINDFEVIETGFITHDDLDFLGCSPDGLICLGVNYYAGLEIKCPTAKTHVKYLRQNQIPNEYKYQILNYFLCIDNCEFVDFVSFNPDFKPKPLFIFRAERNDYLEQIDEAKTELVKFYAKFLKYYDKIIF